MNLERNWRMQIKFQKATSKFENWFIFIGIFEYSKNLSSRCGDCGKLFKSTSEAEYHATKSGHENFEESTEEIAPLTEEQKVERLAELKAKAAARKKEAEIKAKEEEKRNTVSEFFPYCHPIFLLDSPFYFFYSGRLEHFLNSNREYRQ